MQGNLVKTDGHRTQYTFFEWQLRVTWNIVTQQFQLKHIQLLNFPSSVKGYLRRQRVTRGLSNQSMSYGCPPPVSINLIYSGTIKSGLYNSSVEFAVFSSLKQIHYPVHILVDLEYTL